MNNKIHKYLQLKNIYFVTYAKYIIYVYNNEVKTNVSVHRAHTGTTSHLLLVTGCHNLNLICSNIFYVIYLCMALLQP